MSARHYYRTTSRTPFAWRLKCACGVVQVVEVNLTIRPMTRTITYRANARSKKVLRVPPKCTREA